MRSILLLTALISASVLLGQPTLVYENHALEAGTQNPMTYCSYSDPGASGENVTWDFTELTVVKDFTGYITSSTDVDFVAATTQLDEFGNKFFYEVTEEGIWQYGYKSKSGKTKTVYTTPFQKVVFPLNYEDSYTSPFAGDCYIGDEIKAVLEGESVLAADAWGTLILPGDVSYSNTIRVKNIKSYTKTYDNSSQEIKIVTYRWYNSTHRYPLLTLIQTEVESNGQVSTGNQAAYNANALKSTGSTVEVSTAEVEMYPNPAANALYVNYISETNTEAKVYITDITGKTVIAPFSVSLTEGTNELDLSDQLSLLKDGLYNVNFVVGNELTSKNLTVKK